MCGRYHLYTLTSINVSPMNNQEELTRHFVFWQNIVSPHQAAFLSELAKFTKVTLIAERAMDSERIEQKWEVPSMDGVEIIVAPTEVQIRERMSPRAIHVFSGIDAYPMVYAAFRLAIKKHCFVIVLAEPYQWKGVKGWLRQLKYRCLALQYGKSIQAIFATGSTGVRCFIEAGFPKSKVFPWGYFINPTSFQRKHLSSVQSPISPRLLFVGRLDINKNVLGLVETLKYRPERDYTLTILGSGECAPKLQEQIAGDPHIKTLGNLPNKEVQALMQSHDLLVLPSYYDGWGTVVNEALMNGMRVVASENCGASILLDGKLRGEVFSFKQPPMLSEVLDRWIKRGPLTNSEREGIRLWADKTISGEVVAKYFLCKVRFITGEIELDVQAPWIS